MARTINEIFDDMIAEKQTLSSLNGLQPASDNATTFLSDLSSASKVAIWRLMFYVIAVSIWVHEVSWDRYYAKLELKVLEAYTGTLAWYRSECFYFQLGDSLTWNGKRYVYATIDPVKQIIKRASVSDLSGQVIIKVAKLVSNSPTALSASELTSFTAYINQVKFAGTNVLVISRDADLLKLNYTIVYDPLVIASNGELISTPGTFPVEDAINDYISNLPFDGVLNITKLTDTIQAVNGVKDPIISAAEAKYGSLPYQAISNNYTANAGHMKIDPANPLNTTLNYVLNA